MSLISENNETKLSKATKTIMVFSPKHRGQGTFQKTSNMIVNYQKLINNTDF